VTLVLIAILFAVGIALIALAVALDSLDRPWP
jgi:hypothetical protein